MLKIINIKKNIYYISNLSNYIEYTQTHMCAHTQRSLEIKINFSEFKNISFFYDFCDNCCQNN